MNIIQITTKLPPAIDGVGDYSLKLADELLKNYGILTHFLTCQRGFEPASVINGFPVVELPIQNPTAFLDSLPKNIYKIILHYSDFPYDQKYGSPFWLLDALAAVKRQQKFKLLVMFHEFPCLHLLNKIFYLFPFQSFVAWRVAEMADIVFTNNSVSKATLTSRLSQPVTNIPVFSNIGEPDHVPLLEKRTRRIVIFGTRGRRARIYQRAMSMLVKACQLLEVEEIYDIGPSLNLNVSKIKGIPLIEIGEKSAQEVSELMLDSLAGIAYSNDNKKLTKSGVFATYCAHGLVPIITQAKSSPADLLEVGAQFLFPGDRAKNLALKSLQDIADNAHKWYKSHSQSKTAAIFASQLLE